MRRPPVILLGGADNSLAIARTLTRYGAEVRVFTRADEIVRYSRFPAEFSSPATGETLTELWHRVMKRDELFGSIVLCCNDEAIIFVAENRQRYGANFVFEESRPELHLQLLDKQTTIALAKATGIDAPAVLCGREQLSNLDFAAVRYPLLIKPIYSHIYQSKFHAKLRLVETVRELQQHLDEVNDLGVDVMLCEFIPGPDSLLCSYYSYFDEESQPLFHFTKRVIRRQPEHFGGGCYHITDKIPDVVEMGLKFFQGIAFRGLANVEFKRDLRDGRLKLIEANARFTAAHQLLVKCGMDTARIVYDRLAGNLVRIPHDYESNVRLWYPLEDFGAFREQRRKSNMSFAQWIRSIAHKQTFPHFDVLDPMPVIVGASQITRKIMRWFRRKFVKR